MKQDIGNYCEDSENLIEDHRREIMCNHNEGVGHINYEDFKCKNEEVDVKIEDDNNVDLYEKVDVNVIESCGGPHINICSNEEEEQGVNSQRINCSVKYKCYNCPKCHYATYEMKCKVYEAKRNMSDKLNGDLEGHIVEFKCTLCSREFTKKASLDQHLLKIHNCKDNVTNKIYECDKCNYKTIRKVEMLQHSRKHGFKDDSDIFKCQLCKYETYQKSKAIVHIKKHHNIRDFKCILCSKEFNRKETLDNHLLKIHHFRTAVTSKVHDCYKCGYATTIKQEILHHNRKHEIKNNSLNFKSRQHRDIRDFKCILCSKEYTHKITLDNHLLQMHNCRNNITSKVHNCDKCSYATTFKQEIVRHNNKHEINIRNFKCSVCSIDFSDQTTLDNHLINIHNRKWLYLQCSL